MASFPDGVSFGNIVIQNDYPILSGGTWNAVYDLSTGKTVYTSGGRIINGPVNMIHGVLNIQSGATASGIYQLANMSGFSGDANPTINIKTGGKLTDSYVFNGHLNVAYGGVSENNAYVSEDVNIGQGGVSNGDNFYNPSDTAESGGRLINPNLTNGSSSFRTSDTISQINVLPGGTLEKQNIVNIGANNPNATETPITFAPGTTYNLSSGYVASNYRHYVIQNDYPILSGGTWNAVYDLSTGKTVYTSGGRIINGPVNMIHGVLNIQSGATASGIYQLANMSGFSGDANPTINIKTGGKLTDSHVFNGYLNVAYGGVSENNELVSEVVKIEDGGVSNNDVFCDPGDTAESGGRLINPNLTNGSSSFRTSDSLTSVSVSDGGTINNPHIINSGSKNLKINLSGNSYNNYCSAVVLKDQSVSNQTILPTCSLSVYGSAYNTIVNGGILYTYSGSIVSGVTANSGNINASGGTITDVTVNNVASALFTTADAAVTGLKLNGAQATITNSATAINTQINSGGTEYVSAGAIDSGATILNNGQQFVSGTTGTFAYARNTIIKDGGQQTIYDWARTENPTVSIDGTINISAGGGINGDVNFVSGGTINVYSGAGVSAAINNNGREVIYANGNAHDTAITNATQIVTQDGVAFNDTVSSNGIVYINSGGVVNNITANDAGTVRVSGGTINTATINNNGIIIVNGGTIADDTIMYGGILNITDGNIGNSIVSSGGSLLISTDKVVPTDEIQVRQGAFINDRQAQQDIVIHSLTKESLTALLNDPTLFALTDSNSITNINTDKNNIVSGNINTGKDSLNSLLNNPDYFAPVKSTPQESLLRTSDFMAPATLSTKVDDNTSGLPTQDENGNNIISWSALDDTTDGAAINLRSYAYKDEKGNTTHRSSFVPTGHANRIWDIGTSLNTSTGKLSNFGLGGVLLYGQAGQADVIDNITYKRNIYIAQGATLTANSSGTTLNNVYIYNATINATAGTIGNLYIDNEAVANIANPAKLTGTLSLESGGKANITTETGGIISLEGTENNGLIISGKSGPGTNTLVTSTIDNFDGNDRINLTDIKRSDVHAVNYVDQNGNPSNDFVTITLNDGSSMTLNIVGVAQTGYTLGNNPDGSLIIQTCFLAGTLITTNTGVITIEAIDIGDIVETFDWKTNQTINSAVTWVGQKHMNVKTYLPDDLAGYPVRVLRNAISENVPNKDLLITSEHCLFFNGNFIPARMLVNGRSIYYDHSITSYDYYHIETEEHSVIWANGVLTESYLDTGNRNVFLNNQKIVSLFNDVKSWDNDAAAPLNVNREFVEPIYNQINERAIQANTVSQTEPLSLTINPNLHLMTELGTLIQPRFCRNGKYIFNIPEGINLVNLVSRTNRPYETIGSFIDDRRELGVLVGDVFIINNNGINKVTNFLYDSELSGWDVIEQSACRWTNGNATLNIHTDYSKKRILIVNILAAGPYILRERKTYKKVV